MSDDRINADFTQAVVIATDDMPWVPSPQAGVERRMLDRIGEEVARATSLVRYGPNSIFPRHEHALGEEFLVLDGTFADEHGDYPAGTYVRNPPGSGHAPRVEDGCTILVKLRQMSTAETEHVVIDTNTANWSAGPTAGHDIMTLYDDPRTAEIVTYERISAGGTFATGPDHGGEEIFVVDGDLSDGNASYGSRTWLRLPAGMAHSWTTTQGALLWIKRGHLASV